MRRPFSFGGSLNRPNLNKWQAFDPPSLIERVTVIPYDPWLFCRGA